MIRDHIFNFHKTIFIRIKNYFGNYSIIKVNMLKVYSFGSMYSFNLHLQKDSEKYVCTGHSYTK